MRAKGLLFCWIRKSISLFYEIIAFYSFRGSIGPGLNVNNEKICLF
jgi:hypothetical protein